MPISSNRLPIPRPPITKKEEIFNLDEQKVLDSHVAQVDHGLLFGNVKSLVDYLIRPTKSEVGRVRVVFKWLATADVETVEGPSQKTLASDNSPFAWLQKIKNGETIHTIFFHHLCQAADIPSVKIRGIAKNARYQVGKEIDLDRLRSQWNAVVIDGKWRLIDVLWCSQTEANKPSTSAPPIGKNQTKQQTISHRINEFFFLTDPEAFIYTHFPDDPKWQLLTKPVTLAEFESMPYLRERFFEMGLSLLEDSHNSVVVETERSEVFIQLGTGVTNGNKNEFRHLLHPPENSKNKRILPRGNAKTDGDLDDAVSTIKHPEELRFHLQLPEPARYRFDIFGRDISKANLGVYDLICSYIIDYKPEGLSCLEVRFFFKEPSEHARYLRKDGASEWLRKKDATLKVKGYDMILSISTPPGPNTIKYLLEDYENSNHLVPAILRSLLYIVPGDARLHEAHDVPNGWAEWKIANMEIKILSHVNGLVRTADGKSKVRLSASKNAEVWYEFHEDNRKRGVPDGAVSFMVTNGTENNIFSLSLSLERPENYLLTVFARVKGVQHKFYHVKSYRIQYELLDFV